MMLQFWIAMILWSATSGIPIGGEAATFATEVDQVESARSTRWEYLIVSFGKTFFVDPVANPEEKQTGASKLVAFSEAGLILAQEATATQAQLDTLGRYGWELIGITGAIGGDQQMVFKRSFDSDRSKKEAALIIEEGRQLALLKKEAEDRRRARLKEQAKEQLIDLDEVDGEVLAETNRQKLDRRFRDAVSTVKGAKVLDVQIAQPEGTQFIAQVKIDGTSLLMQADGKFRSSQAAKLAEQVANEISRAGKIRTRVKNLFDMPVQGEMRYDVRVVILYAGKENVVQVLPVLGDW